MKQEDVEKLARDLMPRNAGIAVLVTSADLKRLCHAILSGDMKREIENAAIATVADEFSDAFGDEAMVTFIRSLIQPPTQKENGK